MVRPILRYLSPVAATLAPGQGRDRFKDGEAQVWTVHLDASEPDSAKCFSWLSEEERDRAARFQFERDRRRFILSHGILRGLLGCFEQRHPADIRYSMGPQGKPGLARVDPVAAESLTRFNMAHSGNLAVFAFMAGCEMGADIEEIRDIPEIHELAQRVFAPEETRDLEGLPEEQRRAGFFRCWTRKEACVKAVGGGLSLPLGDFRVTLGPREPARLLSIGGEVQAAQHWTLHDLAPAPGYAGAVACACREGALRAQSLVGAGVLLEALAAGLTVEPR